MCSENKQSETLLSPPPHPSALHNVSVLMKFRHRQVWDQVGVGVAVKSGRVVHSRVKQSELLRLLLLQKKKQKNSESAETFRHRRPSEKLHSLRKVDTVGNNTL